MPGGTKEAWEIVAPIFQKIAAQVEGRACCEYMGPNGAGHYVKMVHNGIEYGDMQLICESYALLRDALGLDAEELSKVFSDWNRGDLDSFLIEITANIFKKKDDQTNQPLVDVILDKAGQKGTGKWTLQSAIDLGVVVSTINAAVEARVLSSMKDQRVRASKILPGPEKGTGSKQDFVDAVRDALYASKIISYAQGFSLFAAASKQNKWNLNFGDIASIWRGGCIIRAKFLNRIKEAFDRNSDLENLMLDDFFRTLLERTQANWRRAIAAGVQAGVALPAFSASLSYFDSYRQERLPANLLQAQRDYFGAHTYERTDKPGTFHTEWLEA
jgi:6-phosphogluconate dehydrogenase